MKKFILILILLPKISFNISAQSVGDYRSVGNGNWNDATKWETYNGNNWLTASTYPGQDPGTGTVTIRHPMEIKITASIPNPIANLAVISDYPLSWEKTDFVPSAVLTFSAENAASLNVTGSVDIKGILKVEEKNGAKSHTLSIGRNLHVGVPAYNGYDCYCYWGLGELQTIALDDKINITFNTSDPTSRITGPIGINFYDVTFNGTGIIVATPISISGTATFINGIVKVVAVEINDGNEHLPGDYGGSVAFYDDARHSGSSSVSYIEGVVSKFGNDPFTFPIGSDGVYAHLTISAPPVYENFRAGYGRLNGFVQNAIGDPDLFSISNCEIWSLTPNINTPDYLLNITVGWTPSSGCGSSPGYISNVSDIRLAKTDLNGTWGSHGEAGSGTISNGSVTMSDVSPTGYFTLGNVGTNCRPPTNLTTSNISSNSALVEWTPVANALSYDIYYKADYQPTWVNAITSVTSTSANLDGLSPLFIYDWKVRANCSSSASQFRQEGFRTNAPCGTPTGLTATNITSATATLNWSAVPNAINYRIEYKRVGAFPTAIIAGINSLSYNLSGLDANAEYNWLIQAYCPEGLGQNAQSFFTTSPICIDNYEINNTSTQAKTISFGNTISAGITSTIDVDWFKITTPNNANTNLDVRLSNLPADYDLYVYNKSLKLVGSSATIGTSNEIVIYSSTARKATYYIKVAGKNGESNSSQCYTLLAQALTSKTGPLSSVRVNEITGDPNEQLIFPNPASEFVYFSFNSTVEGKGNVQVLNSSGQLLKQSPLVVNKGFNQVKIPINEISPGLYLLTITRGELIMKKKFVIAR